MTADMLLTLVILFIAIVFFVTEWLRVDVVALGVLLALMLSGILTVEQGIAGFSSKAVISIGALFIVGGAVFHTGLANVIAAQILRVAGEDERRLLLVLMISVAVLSAFISSTGVVALMLPALVSLSNRRNIAPSRLLIPVAYCALLGGTATLIGTPPNVIASDALIAGGFGGLPFFSFAPPGVALVAIGTAYMLFFGAKVLPTRKPIAAFQSVETPEQLFDIHNLPDKLFRLHVLNGSTLAGETVESSRLRADHNLTIVRILRDTPTRREVISHIVPETVFQQDDIIIVQGDSEAVQATCNQWQAGFMLNENVERGDIITGDLGIAEVLLRPRSELLGKTLREANFGAIYRLTVLAINRPGGDIPIGLKDTALKFGDMLIVQGAWDDIFALKRQRHDFVVMGEPEAAQMGAFARTRQAPFALFILAGMVLLIALNIMELTTASLLAAVMMVLAGCLTMDEAYRAIDWKSLVLIAGMLPMSTALEQVGAVSAVSSGLIGILGSLGPVAVLAGLFLMGMVFTQVLSNTTTAVLLAPVALLTAAEMGVAPQAFMVGIVFSTSLAFATPVASPVNTLVMTAGNYKFSDYARAGILLMIIGMLISLIILPLLWGF
jgi:di/tricarboxylate transporter